VLVVLMMVFTLGMAMERRRIRHFFHSDEDLMSAERAGYEDGLKHGYNRALYEQKQRARSGRAPTH